MFKSKKLRILLIALIVGAGIGVYAWQHRNDIDTDDAGFASTVVTISPKVAGYVISLPISDNEMVHKGQILLQIDPTDYRIALQRAQANLTAAQAGQESGAQTLSSTRISAPGTIDEARAMVAQAQANYTNAASTLKRLRSISEIARSKQELDEAVAQEAATRSQLLDANARLRSAGVVPQTVAAAQAAVQQRIAQVAQAQADVDQAQKNLTDTTVIAPLDGRISARGVERGDYVQAGQQLLSVVGTDYWIVANYKETQLTRVHRGQPVTIHIDAYPSLRLTGRVNSIQSGTGSVFSAFPAQNATGNFVNIVQRVPVKITDLRIVQPSQSRASGSWVNLGNKPPVAWDQLAIGPGLSVEPTIDVTR